MSCPQESSVAGLCPLAFPTPFAGEADCGIASILSCDVCPLQVGVWLRCPDETTKRHTCTHKHLSMQHIYIYVCIYIYIHTQTHIRRYGCMYVCMHVKVCVRVCGCVWVCVRVCVYAYKYLHMYMGVEYASLHCLLVSR